MNLKETFHRLAFVPVVEIDNADDAVPLAEALLAGGLGSIEITLRTDAGLAAIARVVASGLPILVGAGTLTEPQQVRRSIDAGAQFGVSPGFTVELAQACSAAGLPWLPGVATPGEVLAALGAGFSTMKFFPAALYGGTAWLRQIGGPLPQASFVATGGVADADAAAYLACPNLLAFGGINAVTRQMIRDREWSAITGKSAQLMQLIRAARPA